MTQPHDIQPPICDYEGSNYRTDFWEGRGRDYEDRVERIALKRLLPEHGKRLLEVGGGFGRLTEEYHMYDQVVMLDYSFSQVEYAQKQLGRGVRYIYVAADAYNLPFKAGVFDGASMIRVIHHMAHVEQVLAEVRRILVPNGTFILEHANKRNVKSVLRYALKRQTWNPHDLEPIEFVKLNYDFHPDDIRQQLVTAGFRVNQQVPVSYFRLGALKRTIPAGLLAKADSLLQRTNLLYSPSIFTQNTAVGESSRKLDTGDIFACPICKADLRREGDFMVCTQENTRYAVRNQIYDFKAPVE